MRVPLLAFLLASSASAQTIEGAVTSALGGAPLTGVTVTLQSGGKTHASVTTDAQGAFRVADIPAGAYRVRFEKKGFEPLDQRAIITAAPLRLSAALTPLAKVTGRVVDAAGTPVAGALVQLIGGRVGFEETTHRNGAFTFESVTAGAYRLWAQAPKSLERPPEKNGSRMIWAPTFYPGATEPAAAAVLTVTAGANLFEQEVRLQAVPVHRIRGVLMDVSGAPVKSVPVTLGSNQGLSFKAEDRESRATTAADGSFEFPDVNDGIWRLSANLESPAGTLRAFTAQTMAGHDLDRVELRLTAPFSIKGVLVSTKPVRSLVMLAPEGGGSVFYQGHPDDSGAFTIEGVYPGRYTIRPISPGAPDYLASIRLGDREVPPGQLLDIVSGALPLTVTYKSDGGTLRGTVEDCASGTVVVYPRDRDLQLAEFRRTAQCDARGRYEIVAIRPGEYYAFAFDRAPGLEEMFFGFELDQSLINSAVRVTVRPNESTSADLKLTQRR